MGASWTRTTRGAADRPRVVPARRFPVGDVSTVRESTRTEISPRLHIPRVADDTGIVSRPSRDLDATWPDRPSRVRVSVACSHASGLLVPRDVLPSGSRSARILALPWSSCTQTRRRASKCSDGRGAGRGHGGVHPSAPATWAGGVGLAGRATGDGVRREGIVLAGRRRRDAPALEVDVSQPRADRRRRGRHAPRAARAARASRI